MAKDIVAFFNCFLIFFSLLAVAETQVNSLVQNNNKQIRSSVKSQLGSVKQKNSLNKKKATQNKKSLAQVKKSNPVKKRIPSSKDVFFPPNYGKPISSATELNSNLNKHLKALDIFCSNESNQEDKERAWKNLKNFLSNSLKDPFINIDMDILLSIIQDTITDKGSNKVILDAELFEIKYKSTLNVIEDTSPSDYYHSWARHIHTALNCME